MTCDANHWILGASRHTAHGEVGMASPPCTSQINGILKRSNAGFRVFDLTAMLNCCRLPLLVVQLVVRVVSALHRVWYTSDCVFIALLQTSSARTRLCSLHGTDELHLDAKAWAQIAMAVIGPTTYCLNKQELAASSVDTGHTLLMEQAHGKRRSHAQCTAR
eukprot:7336266-Prymnesium_polylepis.2